MSTESARQTYRGFVERQLELWNRRLQEAEGAAHGDPERAALLVRMKTGRSSLAQILVRLGADRTGVPEEARAEAQSVISELGQSWLRWQGS